MTEQNDIDSNDQRRYKISENHVVTSLMAILIGLGGWNLYSTNQLQSSQEANYERFIGKINLANERIITLKDNISNERDNYYTRLDASNDKSELISRITVIQIGLNRCNRDITDLKDHLDISK